MNEQLEKFLKVLKILLKKLGGIDFALLGTFNLSLQGIKIIPGDLDLLTDDEGIEKISQIFKSTVVKEKEVGYKETQFQIKGIEVHVVSNKKNPLRPQNFKKHLVWIEKEGLKIPCMSLESELSFYRQARREKDRGKVRLIQERLQELK